MRKRLKIFSRITDIFTFKVNGAEATIGGGGDYEKRYLATVIPFFEKLFRKTGFKRTIFFVISDFIIFGTALYLSFYLRFDGVIPDGYMDRFHIYTLLFTGVKTMGFCFFQIYRFTWSFIGLYELMKLFMVQTLSSVIISASILFLAHGDTFQSFPRSILLIEYAPSMIMVGGLRISKRVYLEMKKNPNIKKKNTLIIGAGNAGEQLVRDMKRTKDAPYLPVAFIDDNSAKRKVSIHGVSVLGGRCDIQRVSKKLNVELAVIAMPSVPTKEIRDIVSYIQKAGIKEIHILPGTKEIISRNISMLDIKKIDLEDLLGRQPAKIKFSQVEASLKDKRVLVTGAGGSIGSELVRQISRLTPQTLLLLDNDETSLFHINNEIGELHPFLSMHCILGDILDEGKMSYIFKTFSPQVVFHAAAYKHVPIMENYPEEAIRVNVLGTKLLAELSCQYGVSRFIFISTDKVVNPTSVMGASKRLAEMVITSFNSHQATQFMAVRFGNVLGSRGSAIPLFQEQIKRGRPITITHPDMKRYFMTIPEAVLLVLQAGSMGNGGDVFILDMGEPVKIYDVACQLIRLSGLEPNKDIPILFTGIRPGEKLFEELLTQEEKVEPTVHPKIFRCNSKEVFSQEILSRRIDELKICSRLHDSPGIISTLKEIIPTYNPNRFEEIPSSLEVQRVV